MSTPQNTDSAHYMLLFRSSSWYKDLSAEQIQDIVAQWMGWFDRLKKDGRAIAGNPLEQEGKVVSREGRNPLTVSDGPFAESKETIGGYFLLKVGSLDEAVEIAKECPGLPYGIAVEVRPVAASCPFSQELRNRENLQAASA